MAAFLKKIFKIFKKDKLHTDCKYISKSIYFDYKNNIRLCPYTDFGLIEQNFDGIWLDINKLKEQRNNCINKILSEEIISECSKCVFFEQNDKPIKNTLKYVYLAHWKFCSLNCSYCEYPKNDNFIEAKHYDILPAIKQLIDAGLINTNTTFIFECGDACAHPEFDKLIYFLLNYECKNIIVKTSGMRFCQSVADIIARNQGEVHISFDSGTRFMYEKIKKLDKFNDAIQTVKRYAAYQLPKGKRVTLSYRMLNSINDNEKELLDWFILAKDLNIHKLTFEIDDKWYNSVRHSVPKYLKDIVTFVKSMADYNNIELEFGACADTVYKLIRQEENSK